MSTLPQRSLEAVLRPFRITNRMLLNQYIAAGSLRIFSPCYDGGQYKVDNGLLPHHHHPPVPISVSPKNAILMPISEHPRVIPPNCAPLFSPSRCLGGIVEGPSVPPTCLPSLQWHRWQGLFMMGGQFQVNKGLLPHHPPCAHLWCNK